MAIFYTGPRPVTRGRKRSNMVHSTKNVAGTYSNWSNFSTEHVLAGAPNTDVVAGAGAYPHGLQLSRWFTGLRTIWPLDDSGGGTRIAGMRYRPLEYKGTDGQGVFSDSSYGHVDRVTSYSLYDNYTFDGIASAETLTSVGHVKRAIGAGGAATFGAFDPHIHKGVDVVFSSTYGEVVPTGNQNTYGHNRVNEHSGLTSSRALNVT